VAGSPVTRRDVVLDLGAGLGALTRPLAATGARVIAVELHPRARCALRAVRGERVASSTLDLRDVHLPGAPYRVVANPPYAGVNALVRRLLADRHLLSADLVVAEAAARGLLRRSSRIRPGDRVPRHAFEHPPPSAGRGAADQANGSRVAPGSWATARAPGRRPCARRAPRTWSRRPTWTEEKSR
jgi:23S rRNA (adenine-N6)-dimethyltransferase